MCLSRLHLPLLSEEQDAAKAAKELKKKFAKLQVPKEYSEVLLTN